MATRYGNVSSVPLSLAVFLATDNYDHNSDPYTISATTLIKPLRQTILATRVPAGSAPPDLASQISSRIGSAIHDAIERAWLDNHMAALEALGYPNHIISRVVVNPDPRMDLTDAIPIYLEQRANKKVGKWTVSGKFDFVGEGRVEDFKSTSTFTIMHNTSDEKYILQGSIYRWLNPTIITRDEMAIQWIFTDWSAAKAKQDPAYPQRRFHQKILPLKSINETDQFIRNKIALLEQYWDAPEEDIPHCNDEDLWRSEPVYKYYKGGVETARSTKNFASRAEATVRFIEDGSKGLIKEVLGSPTACRYCNAFLVCTQKDLFIATGELAP